MTRKEQTARPMGLIVLSAAMALPLLVGCEPKWRESPVATAAANDESGPREANRNASAGTSETRCGDAGKCDEQVLELTPAVGTEIDRGSCVTGDQRSCGPENACRRGTQICARSEWGPCEAVTLPEPRDCTSELDNDCDGRPDNTVDDTCRCVMGTSEPC
jgi:hypothetical protein